MDTFPLLTSLARHAPRAARAVYLVGGCVRDVLLRRPIKDFDVALEGEAFAWARAVAEQTGGRFVALDAERDIARVVFKDESGAPALQVDVVPLGVTIQANLAQRDFTINAMALHLGQWVHEFMGSGVHATMTETHEFMNSLTRELIDPFGGLSDLRACLIRVVRPEAFTEDPLRLLRAVRFAAQLRFDIEEATWQSLCQHAPLLARVAAERIRDEFFALLDARSCVPYLRLMQDAGLLSIVVPAGSAAPADWERALQTVAAVERITEGSMDVWVCGRVGERDFSHPHILTPIRSVCSSYLATEISGGRARGVLLKFAALLCPVMSSAQTAEAIAQHLRLSSEEAHVLSLVARHHDLPRRLIASSEVSGRARRRFFRAAGSAAVEVLLLALAEQSTTLPDEFTARHQTFIGEMLRDYFEGAPTAHPTRFVRGDEIMRRYDLPAGPQIRALLEAVEEAEAEGEVRNKDDAWRLLDAIKERQQAVKHP